MSTRPPSPEILDAVLARGRRRLRARRVVQGAVIGAWVGVGALALVAGLSRFAWPLPIPPVGIGVVGMLGATGLGGLLGALRPVLGDRELALLLDRAMATDERLVTAMHLAGEPPSPARDAALAELSGWFDGLEVTGLPLRLPRGTRWLGPAFVVAMLAFLAPQRPSVAAPASPVQHEGERLAERLDELEEAYEAELPEDVAEEIEELVEDLRADRVTPEEAVRRLEQARERLDAESASLSGSGDLLDEMSVAAEQLASSRDLDDLADALSRGDVDAAAQAARELGERLADATPEERRRMGEALEEAGRRLADDPQLGGAGEAMQQAGQKLQEQAGQQGGAQGAGQQGDGQQGSGEGAGEQGGGPQGNGEGAGEQGSGEQGSGEGSGQQGGGQQGSGEGSGQQGSGQQGAGQQGSGQGAGQQGSGQGAGGQGGSGNPPGSSDLEQLARELERNRDLAERLQRDREALARAQRTNGALEAAGAGLGGGQDSSQGQSSQGAGGAEPGSGSEAGTRHTWEDDGTFEGDGVHRDADRTGDRRGGAEVDDYEQLYDPERLEGIDALLTGAEGRIDASGQVDTVPTRLTGGQERAGTDTVRLPATYREAADEALSNERVPPGYRDAVRDYFDAME